MSGNHWEEEPMRHLEMRRAPTPDDGPPTHLVTIKTQRLFKDSPRARSPQNSRTPTRHRSETWIKVNYWYDTENYYNETLQALQGAQGQRTRRERLKRVALW